jgi:hypothetical protein
MKTTQFKSFWFEGQLYFREVKNEEEAVRLLEAYGDDFERLKKAKVKPSSQKPGAYVIAFGFYPEYDGELTLGEWLAENNMLSFFQSSIV